MVKNYLAWQTVKISDFTPDIITEKYQQGFVFVRTDKGEMQQTRSVRVDLDKFQLSSENRRVLKKTEKLQLQEIALPIAENDYSWEIHKLGKEFYQDKFGEKLFSANKIKQLVTEEANSNFNLLLRYLEEINTVGYCIAYDNTDIIHYAYPFYNFHKYNNNYGMGMMLRAVIRAQEQGKKFIYLGSATEPADKYKLQFSGLEWFDEHAWSQDVEALKNILTA